MVKGPKRTKARKLGGSTVKEAPVQGQPVGPRGDRPWRIRYSSRILTDYLDDIGHDALARARRAIDKKLKVNPEQYGAPLHSPLHGVFKLKASHVRIAYHVEAKRREVWVLMIGDRREIWEDRQEEILERLTRMPTEGESPRERPATSVDDLSGPRPARRKR
ncbi:MAG: hypothetical protein WKG32_10360 [Gemmatimonadaceae bacterium]